MYRASGARPLLVVCLATVALSALVVGLSRRGQAGGAGDDAGQQLAVLRQQLARVEATVAANRVRLASAQRPGGGAGGPQAAPGTPAAPPEVADPEPSDGRDVVASLDARFYREPAATAWSRGALPRATAALRRLVTPGSTVGDVECRQTMCRIEATHQDLGAYRRFGFALMRGRQGPDGLWGGGINSRVTDRRPGLLSTVTFLAREGAPAPDVEPGPEPGPR
jgi:hypothetical protein